MVATLGKRIVGKTKYIPKAMLTTSVPGSLYEIEIQTKGVPNPEEALRKLSEGLMEKFKVKMVYGEVRDDVIRLQIKGSPFLWSAILLFIPQILAILGIIVILISVFLLVRAIPIWVIALLLLGTTAVYVAPRIKPIVGLEVK